MILAALAVVYAIMFAELAVSRHHERWLREHGAVEPPGDVYQLMRFVYPSCFLAIGGEAAVYPTAGHVVAGITVFVASKALKTWAIRSLGENWSFRVLVRPGRPLVATGPYRYLRHPNYVAIVGEIVGVALFLSAPVTGVVSLAAMGFLLWRRIAVEERALGMRG